MRVLTFVVEIGCRASVIMVISDFVSGRYRSEFLGALNLVKSIFLWQLTHKF